LVPSLFDAKELVVCATLTGHTDVVYHVTYAMQKFGGHLLIASAAVDWTVKIWRMEVCLLFSRQCRATQYPISQSGNS